MIQRRTYLRSISALAAAPVVAGCTGDGDGTTEPGGGGGSGGADTTQPAGTEMSGGSPSAPSGEGETGTTSGANSAQAEYPDYDWGQFDGSSPTAATTVEISSSAFDPLVARVPAGEEISFPNGDSIDHTVTAPALGLDRVIQGGEEATITVDEPGTYDYVCRFHPPNMLGRLVVEEGVTVDGGGTETGAGGGGGTATDGGGGGGPSGPY